MDHKIRKSMKCAGLCFLVGLAIWLIVCLGLKAQSAAAKALMALSLVPACSYVFFGIRLLQSLGMDKLYRKGWGTKE